MTGGVGEAKGGAGLIPPSLERRPRRTRREGETVRRGHGGRQGGGQTRRRRCRRLVLPIWKQGSISSPFALLCKTGTRFRVSFCLGGDKSHGKLPLGAHSLGSHSKSFLATFSQPSRFPWQAFWNPDLKCHSDQCSRIDSIRFLFPFPPFNVSASSKSRAFSVLCFRIEAC